MTKLKQVEIFTDGSCRGNPGKGAYGILLRFGKIEKKISQGFIETTNNRMELMAPIIALDSLKEKCHVKLTTDSKYVKNGITLWIKNWQKNNWQSASKKPIKNQDLWQKLYLVTKKHEVSWHWVKGHSGNRENEICDKLAFDATSDLKLKQDIGYFQANQNKDS